MKISFKIIRCICLINFSIYSCKEIPKEPVDPVRVEDKKTDTPNDTVYDSTVEWDDLKHTFAQHYSTLKLKDYEKLLDQQTLINIVYYGFDSKIHKGQLVCNQSVANEVKNIFIQLYQVKFPINSVKPISEFGFDDNRSMEADNTTCFDYRLKTRKNGLSKHAYGTAIDLNPLQNPFVYNDKILPKNYSNEIRIGKISYTDSLGKEVIRIFKAHGWKWGGNWKNSKDYMHFEK